jgi:proteic killer suppression protein
MQIQKTPAFNRRFKKLSEQQKKDFYTALRLFCQDAFHPKLKTHKLKGRWKAFHSFRVNYSDRCIFYFLQNDDILLYDIGSHQIYQG